MKIALATLLSLLAASSATAGSMQLQEEWVYLPAFFGPGHQGITVGDYDGDGNQEALVTGYSISGFSASGTEIVATIAGDASGSLVVDSYKLYERHFVSPIVPAPPENGQDRVATVFETETGWEIAVLGGKPVGIVRTIAMDVPLQMYEIIDVDADGNLEVLGSISGHSYGDAAIVDFATGGIEWQRTGWVGNMMAVQLDADPALEMVIESSPGVVIDGATKEQDWSYPGAFGSKLLKGNFDTDTATREFASGDWRLQIFRGTPYSPIKEIEVGEIGAALATDTDGDGITEVIIGQGQWGTIQVYDPLTGTVLDTFANPEHGVSAIAMGNIDDDLAGELIFGAGLTSTSTDLLRVYDTSSGFVELDHPDRGGNSSVVHLADVNADGSLDALRMTPHAIPEVLDGTTGQPSSDWPTQISGWGNLNTSNRILSAQLDADPALEVLVARNNSHAAATIYDGRTWQEQFETNYEDTGRPWANGVGDLLFADVTGTAEPEIVLLTLFNPKIIVIEPLTGAVLWSSVTLNSTSGGYGNRLLARNIDADPALELVALVGETLWAFDNATKLLEWTYEAEVGVYDLVAWGEAPDCTFGLVYSSGLLQRRTCGSRADSGSVTLPDSPLLTTPIDDSGQRFLLVSNDRVHLMDENSGPTTLSEFYGHGLADGNVGDVINHGHGLFTLLLGSPTVVTRLEINLDRLFGDGFD